MAWCSEALAAAEGAGATGAATAAGLGLKTWGWSTQQREAMFQLLTQRTPPGWVPVTWRWLRCVVAGSAFGGHEESVTLG